jgi:ribosomal protein L13E
MVTEPDVARTFGEAVSDLVFAPDGPLAVLLRVQLADGRLLTFGARDLATPAAIADGVVRPAIARALRRDVRAGRREPTPFTLAELRAATVAYFTERAAGITRDNIRSLLADRIPDHPAVVKVERVRIDNT